MDCLKLFFTDMWDHFDIYNNSIVEILSEKYEVMIDEDHPDILFYSVFGERFLDYDCIRVFYTGESVSPDLNLCDYAIGFDYIEFGDRYTRCPYMYIGHPLKTSVDILNNLNQMKPDTDQKQKYIFRDFCSFVYSNENAAPIRDHLFNSLCEYKKVNSGGRHLNNIGYAVDDKQAFLEGHKFTLAIENSEYEGYTTEKLIDAYRAFTVPIYWGNPKVAKDFNPASMICAYDFSTEKELIDYIIKVDSDDDLYWKILKERKFSSPEFPAAHIKKYKDFLLSISPGVIRRNNSLSGKLYQERRLRERDLSSFAYNKVLKRKIANKIRKMRSR